MASISRVSQPLVAPTPEPIPAPARPIDIDSDTDRFEGGAEAPQTEPAPPSDGPAPSLGIEHKLRTVAAAVKEKALDVANKAITAGVKLIGKIQDKLSDAAARINGEG